MACARRRRPPLTRRAWLAFGAISIIWGIPYLLIRVAVRDTSPEVPVRRLGRLDDVSGRGVVIVEQLASAWGVERDRNGGKRVWFEVAC